MTTATPAKLRNGTWGARTRGVPAQGATVRIQTRAGKSWDARVGRVLWSGTDRDGSSVALCATSSLDRASDRYGETYCGGTCPVRGHICGPKHGPCHDCE